MSPDGAYARVELSVEIDPSEQADQPLIWRDHTPRRVVTAEGQHTQVCGTCGEGWREWVPGGCPGPSGVAM